MSEFEGKVAIVTGGANGMGEAVVRELAANGATVVIADIDRERAETVEAAVRSSGGTARAVHTDVRDEDQVRALVDTVVAEYGRIDILDNNAASLELTANDPDVVALDPQILHQTLQGNLIAPFLCSKYVIPVMIAGGGGSIINMASVAGFTGDIALTAYALSKAGVIQLTRAIAVQYGKQNVRANAIAPATILTPNVDAYMPQDYRDAYIHNSSTPFLGAPEDVSGLVVFLASQRARYMTGHVIPVDGGITSALAVAHDRRT
ncbi:SDR family NAD(P)-dependent oxidoreductase [Nocardia jinanensis]|uniref:Short-chain type dehydrogenase/reductase y4lA n=1 Tax=Nocardia jinanensis TaxID=382504 RepID=A0A917VXD0_9NOCA|nr:SDR family NAD(P)-dependent oxidoreductase [Nocardia jinanensis]GGL40127.1 putative short-chain type dehydrogenase/reductase y4lA [Nocardia jinanensis]